MRSAADDKVVKDGRLLVFMKEILAVLNFCISP
jgi:hypothetical protein